MKVPDIAFGKRRCLAGDFADIVQRVVVVECLQMILERLAADSNALLDDQRRFNRAERISLDSVRRVSDLDVVVMLQIAQRFQRERAQAIEPFLFTRTASSSAMMATLLTVSPVRLLRRVYYYGFLLFGTTINRAFNAIRAQWSDRNGYSGQGGSHHRRIAWDRRCVRRGIPAGGAAGGFYRPALMA